MKRRAEGKGEKTKAEAKAEAEATKGKRQGDSIQQPTNPRLIDWINYYYRISSRQRAKGGGKSWVISN